MFGFSIKKMLRNKWMLSCLLIGFIVSVAVISCIPVYTSSILQRLLIKDLEALQAQSNVAYPGNILITTFPYQSDTTDATAKEKEAYHQRYLSNTEKLQNGLVDQLGFTMSEQSRQYCYYKGFVTIEKETRKKGEQNISLYAQQDIQNHTKLLAGEYPKSTMENGVIEVMMTQEAFDHYGFTLGQETTMTPYDEENAAQKLKIVGVFTYKELDDLYWYYDLKVFKESVIMDFDLFQNQFDAETPLFRSQYYFYTFDYHQIKMQDIPQIMGAASAIRNTLGKQAKMVFPAEEVLQKFIARQTELNSTLWILLAPVVLMLVFYIFMISTLIMEHEKADISILKSRGANNWQVFSTTLIQGGIVAMIAIVVGTFLGYQLCQALGLSNGFLEFVNRKSLKPEFRIDSVYLVSTIGIIVAGMVALFIPAIGACRMSIVEYKRKQSKSNKSPLWKKIGLDVILLAVAWYALYNYKSFSKGLSENNVGMMSNIDPMLFLINTLLILALGLVFLRLFPYVIKLVFFVGKRFYSAGSYMSLLSISRSNGKEQFIILFLIFTVSLAMFNATAARTLNTFMEDRVKYQIGADVVVAPQLPSESTYYTLIETEDSKVPQFIKTTKEKAQADGNYVVTTDYTDIPFAPFQEIKGVEVATKVYRNSNVTVTGAKNSVSGVKLMGITPTEFAEVAWMRSDLLPHHINSYLNLLAENPNAVLLSSSMEGKVRPGEEITIEWKDQPYSMDCIVYGFVDYWPTFKPISADEQEKAATSAQNLVVVNYSLIKAQMKLEPYEIWLKADDTTPRAEMYNDITEKKLMINSMKDTDQELIKVKNDPMLQGINGTLTLSFIVTLFVTLAGFLIFWILNIKERTLQFAILRAMGLSKNVLIRMIIFEQILISGGALAAGVVIGTLVSRITVPLLQLLYPPTEQVPPFQVYMENADYAKIFVVIGGTILVGMAVLGCIISKIKIDQALKLGEE